MTSILEESIEAYLEVVEGEEARQAEVQEAVDVAIQETLELVRRLAEDRITNGLDLRATEGYEAESRLRVLAGLVLLDTAECIAQNQAGYPQVAMTSVLSHSERLLRARDEAIALRAALDASSEVSDE